MGKKTDASALIKKLNEIIDIFGTWDTTVSDNGSPFSTKEIGIYFFKLNIRQVFTPPYHPASNGMAERFVRTFKEGITKLLDQG